MARLRRVVAPKLPHHVTQRGNRKANVYQDRQDQEVYLRLLLERSKQYSFEILCYCLMTNHIHLVMVPHQEDSLSKGLSPDFSHCLVARSLRRRPDKACDRGPRKRTNRYVEQADRAKRRQGGWMRHRSRGSVRNAGWRYTWTIRHLLQSKIRPHWTSLAGPLLFLFAR